METEEMIKELRKRGYRVSKYPKKLFIVKHSSRNHAPIYTLRATERGVNFASTQSEGIIEVAEIDPEKLDWRYITK